MDVIRWSKPGKVTVDELRQKLTEEGLESELYSDAPGTKYGRHKHNFDDFVVIAAGKMKIGAGIHVWTLKPGDRLNIPANTVHWAEVLGKEEVKYLSAAK